MRGWGVVHVHTYIFAIIILLLKGYTKYIVIHLFIDNP